MFDIARQNLEKQFRSRDNFDEEHVQRLLSCRLRDINYIEEKSHEGITNYFKCRFACFQYIFSEHEKLSFGIGFFFTILSLYIAIRCALYTGDFVEYISMMAFWAFLILFFFPIYLLIKNKKFSNNRVFYIFWVIAFILSIPFILKLAI